MCTARKQWKTMSLRVATYKADCVQIPVNLKNILSVDTAKQIIRVEPMVTMSDITDYLVPKGYALAVHPEMDDLTIGGLCMGVGIETTSHRHGFLFETIEAFEVIIADGTLIRATRTQNADLFHALPWSHGTLGFMVAVELNIVPIKPYMRLQYIPCYSQEEFCTQFQSLSEAENPPAYLEALVYSPSKSMILCGDLETLTRKKAGYHLLYADIFMTREEFEEMFNHQHYQSMRRKYHAEHVFPDVYEKVLPESWLLNLKEYQDKAF